VTGWDLVNTPDPVDITDRYYKFHFDVSEKAHVFTVTERTCDIKIKGVKTFATKEKLEKYQNKNVLSKEVMEKFVAVMKTNNELNSMSRSIYDNEDKIRESQKKQDRLRYVTLCSSFRVVDFVSYYLVFISF